MLKLETFFNTSLKKQIFLLIAALIKLNVCHNQLEETPAFGEMKKLQVLLLDNNSIKKFPEVNGCSALRELYLSNNSIPVRLNFQLLSNNLTVNNTSSKNV